MNLLNLFSILFLFNCQQTKNDSTHFKIALGDWLINILHVEVVKELHDGHSQNMDKRITNDSLKLDVPIHKKLQKRFRLKNIDDGTIIQKCFFSTIGDASLTDDKTISNLFELRRKDIVFFINDKAIPIDWINVDIYSNLKFIDKIYHSQKYQNAADRIFPIERINTKLKENGGCIKLTITYNDDSSYTITILVKTQNEQKILKEYEKLFKERKLLFQNSYLPCRSD